MNERAIRIAVAVLLGVVGIWAGIRIHSISKGSTATTGIRIPVGEASAPTPSDLLADSAPQPTKIPDRLPQFSLADLEGRKTPIDAWSGKSLIINFWATWCAPCRREIPLLEGVAGAWQSRGVQVIGIAVDHREAVASYVREMKIGYPILLGEQDALDVAAALGFGSPVFPFTVFADRQGDVVALFVGELHEPQVHLILTVVQELDQDHMPLKEARRTIAEGLRKLAPAKPG